MGGCRCTYRNCSLRTDGKTHMFHYPVFDKVRCHQWLTNAHKLEFLNLKVSQLKNRVVCQHHFKDDNFMNFKKDKLTFDAVPTEDGPYCDSSQLDETKTEQDESKVFSISLDDIENEYLTIIDKKANFSVKYGDFLTNCDLMDLDALNSLNQINENNQIKGLRALPAKPIAPKDLIPSKRPVKKVRPLTRKNRGKQTTLKNTILQGNHLTINHDNTVDISKLIKAPRTKKKRKSLNLVLKVSHVPIEFEGRKPNDKIQENKDQSIDLNVLDESRLLNDQSIDVNILNQSRLLNDQSFEVKVLDEPKLLNEQSCDVKVFDEPKLLNEQSFDVKVFDEPKPLNDQSFDVRVLDEPKLLNNQSFDVRVLDEPKLLNNQSFDVKVLDEEPNPSNNNPDKTSIKERKKIRIISEKKISEPVSVTGRLEPVSPTRILTLPNKRRCVNPTPLIEIPELPINNSNTESSFIATDTSKDNIILEKSEIEAKNNISSCSRDKVSPQEKRNNAININQNEVLANASPRITRSYEINKGPNKFLPKTSLLRNKIPPERVAEIAEKRKFNMKLRDIIEDCLDKLDKPDKTDFENRKVSKETKTKQSKKLQVGSYFAKDPELPSVQDYTIAYLEARMKKMENNLLNKIGENTQKIVELKQSVAPSCKKKTVHTQTSVSEDVHKKQLYTELSKYLSQEANSLIYEELFINKYTKEVSKGSASTKRRKRR